jgi:hypothetical protein
MRIDYEKLRSDMEDYYGTAATCGMPAAFMDAMNVRSESNEALLERAVQNGFDLNKYENNTLNWFDL